MDLNVSTFEKDFDTIYIQHLEKEITEIELFRKKNIANLKKAIIASIIGSFVFICIAIGQGTVSLNLLAVKVFLTIFFIATIISSLAIYLSFRGKLKRKIYPLLKHLFPSTEIKYYDTKITREKNSFFGSDSLFNIVLPSATLPKSNDISIYDMMYYLYPEGTHLTKEEEFSGKYLGLPFTIADIESSYYTGEKNKNQTRHQIFRGMIVKIDLTVPHDDQLILIRNNGPKLLDFKRIKLEDVEFEKYYDIYGKDQIVSRKLLNPKTMENILLMGKSVTSLKKLISNTSSIPTTFSLGSLLATFNRAKVPQLALLEQGLFILIDHRNPFELRLINMFKQIDKESVKKSLAEVYLQISLVFKTIERLQELL